MSKSSCVVCGAACDDVCDPATVKSEMACSNCHASAEWRDLFQASQVASEQCAQLQAYRLLSETDRQRVDDHLASARKRWVEQVRQGMRPPKNSGMPPQSLCRKCGRPAGASQKFCTACGNPAGTPADRLRHMDFVFELFVDASNIGIATGDADRCVDALRSRIEKMEESLKRGGAASPNPHRRNLAEILLDPRSIRWLLASGGVLLAVGLVIFLSSLGVFRNAMVVASAMGLGTLATLGGGIAMIRWTRHSLAGRATALLGCLIMPLNLWFYNANHLITLDGHLWVAAMVCCVLYAAAAFVLEDPLFVYVLLGGITMTGTLVLADLHRVAEVSAPATLLVALGLISLHAERAFADDDGPFSRKRFGVACFRSAQVLIGLGLTLLLFSQLLAWASSVGWQFNSLGDLPQNQFLAFGLVLAGGYGYLYSSLVVRRHAIFDYGAITCLLWAEMLGIQIGHWTNNLPVLLSALALTSLAMNLAAPLLSRHASNDQHRTLATPLPPLGLVLIALALLAGGLIPHVQAVFFNLHSTLTRSDVAALALTAVSSRVAASLNGQRRQRMGVAYLVATAVATFITATSLLTLIGLQAAPVQTAVLMAIPMLYLLAAQFHKDGPAKRSLPVIASTAAIVLFFFSLIFNSSLWLNPLLGRVGNGWLATYCLEAAAFFAIASAMSRSKTDLYLASVMVCGLIVQLFGLWAFPLQAYLVAIAAAGVAASIVHRLLDLGVRAADPWSKALYSCANSLISLPMAAAMLMSLSQLGTEHFDPSTLWMLGILSVLALLSAALAGAGGVRRWYLSLTIGQIAISLLILAEYSTLTLPRKLESFSVMAGLASLLAGYGMWYREQDGRSDGAGICLLSAHCWPVCHRRSSRSSIASALRCLMWMS